MTNYITKANRVFAVMWDGHNIKFLKPIGFWFEIHENPRTLMVESMTHQQQFELIMGDYVVLDGQEIYTMCHEDFEHVYMVEDVR